jgi:TsgA-like MFS transporter
LRVLLFAAALLAYLTGQNVFTIWSPTYLQSAFHLSALQAGGIVGTFFGASSFGLITAALLVTRVAPRAVLCVSMTLAAVVTLLLAQAPDAGLFFALATAFGFCSTCMFKLMISIGSEQIASSPPQLVTFLLFCTSLGGIVAPAVSAPVVKAFGVHASLYLTWAAYAAAFALVAAALLVERIVAGHRGVPAAAAAAS